MPETPRTRARRWIVSSIAGVACALFVVGLTGAGVVSAAPAQAASGSSSAVTITAKQQDPNIASAPLPDLSVTVSQTQNLVAQGIRLSWSGGKKSTPPGAANGGTNFLQIFMCWGDDPADTTRPDRTTCVYGGADASGATRDGTRPMPISQIPAEDQPYTAPSSVSFLPPYTGIPFVARDGTRVDGIKTDPKTGKKSLDTSVNLNINKFFTPYTTNEIPWAGSGDDGTGSVSFEVQTAAQSPALGCGNPVVSGGVTTGAGCWLVVLPRGTADNGSSSTDQSGLFIDSWRHALAVRIGFEPLGSRCPEGTAERQLAGSELAFYAISSWQPAVCKQAGASVYSLLTIPEVDAVNSAATTDGAPLALTSYPYQTDGPDPLQYAPIALTGVTISMAIDRLPDPFKTLPAAYADAARTSFKTMNLTPRLLAKLLTYSYKASLPTGANLSYLKGNNPYNITKDPDFLAVNDPEWAAQNINSVGVADVIMPQGRSDAARAVWAYIAADPDARDFLASKPDPWGMVVNPWYSTDSTINPTGTAFSLDREDFPKADPVEYDPPNAGPINLVTWAPYANDLATVSYLTLRGDGQLPGYWDVSATPPKYTKAARALPGNQALLGLTSTAAASRYQVVTASLLNSSSAKPTFVAPTADSLEAAAAAMTPLDAKGQVLSFVSQTTAAQNAPNAYPLTMPVYAAANPTMSDPVLRNAYGAFIRYAVSTTAETPGVDPGQLPPGYAPLPQSWIDQSLATAAIIESGHEPTPSPSPSSPATTGSVRAPALSSVRGTGTSAGTASAATAAPNPNPTPSGTAAPVLSSAMTPDDPDSGGMAFAIPATVLAGGAVALLIPLFGRRRRI
ncbi:hypothetical protein ABCS02_08575 [Microbacterium sp. X-17]|uniref:hypothetical protein n=1 Tax=Microbacterium sp. X-17 TaxID=3144404 RepID=UPI0031F4D2E8